MKPEVSGFGQNASDIWSHFTWGHLFTQTKYIEKLLNVISGRWITVFAGTVTATERIYQFIGQFIGPKLV